MDRGGGNDARAGSGQRISEAHCDARWITLSSGAYRLGHAPFVGLVSPQLARFIFCAATGVKKADDRPSVRHALHRVAS